MLKQLKLYYLLVALPYILLLAGSAYFFEPIKRTILNNPIPHLNYAIIVIVLTGGLFILNNARRLVRQARQMTEFSAALHNKTDMTTLRDMANGYMGALACILQMIASSSDRSISAQEQAALEHELVNARARLVRRNALPQYLTGLLVAMGLLGTFIGLLATLADISVLIGSFADIDMNNIDPIQVFKVMIERMKAPMTSMGIAFSTSMFGLLGSIVIGLMMLGIRRIQGDIFTVLSSEVARHIEMALSFESLSFRGTAGGIGCYEEATDLTSKILMRIEERLAETARVRQRALTAEIDDFKKQRADMLQVMVEQTEASNSFRSQLQQLGSQLGDIFTSMAKNNSEITSQVSALTVQLGGDAKETHKLLASQIDEQKRLRDSIDAYNIEEWLAESAQMQQRAIAAELEDFKTQRGEMLQALTEQNEANKNFRDELQQVNGQLGSILDSQEKGNGEISNQLSELTILSGADAKEGHRLLNVTGNNLRSELQQLGGQLETIFIAAEKGNEQLSGKIGALTEQMNAEIDRALQQHDAASSGLRNDLQQLVAQLSEQLVAKLDSVSGVTEKGNDAIAGQVSALMAQMASESGESQEQRGDLLQTLSKQLEASTSVRGELRELGGQLESISHVFEKGNSDICQQIAGLAEQLSDEEEISEEEELQEKE